MSQRTDIICRPLLELAVTIWLNPPANLLKAVVDAPSSREFSGRTRCRIRGDASIVGWILTRLYLTASAPVGSTVNMGPGARSTT